MKTETLLTLGAVAVVGYVVYKAAQAAGKLTSGPGSVADSFFEWLKPTDKGPGPTYNVNELRKQQGLPPVDTTKPWTRGGNVDRKAKPMAPPKPALVVPNAPAGTEPLPEPTYY